MLILNIPLRIKHGYIRRVPRRRDLVVESPPRFLICTWRDLELCADVHHRAVAFRAAVGGWVGVTWSLETAALATAEADQAGGGKMAGIERGGDLGWGQVVHGMVCGA